MQVEMGFGEFDERACHLHILPYAVGAPTATPPLNPRGRSCVGEGERGSAMTEEDEAAFDEFLAARTTALLRTAVLVCGASAHDAEDLVQGALEKVYRHWPRIRHDNPESYARRVVVNAAISRSRRRKVIHEITFARPPETAAPQFDLDLRDALIEELRLLPARMRAVVVLRYWEDLSEIETASLLGCSVGTVKSQAARGLARMRARIGALKGTSV
ncbi:hypothetical protein GCM10022226_76320 [Sphaerisporangium flaviroseum]|uniref:SigE family RNA polymerase sigma factor n=2 Tax=Sphaerisporangium flaviroseum TaxID=509199 RepID=A0ABP7JFR7_9ACTN